VTGSGILRERFGEQVAAAVHAASGSDCADLLLSDGDTLTLGAQTIRVLYTPGHTDTDVSFLVDGAVFTGDTLLIRGSGRTDLVLAAAAKMQQDGRRVLVLSMMPSNKGDVRRLQLAAAAEGYDAAVINHQRQLAGIDKHAGSYDAVLIDLPAVNSEAMQDEGAVHNWLAANASFHRHLVVPMDKDPRDMVALSEAARLWSCDWIALSRTDLTTRAAKLLDVIETFHLPISLESRDPLGHGSLTIAQSAELIGRVLATAEARQSTFTKIDVCSPTEAVIW